MLPTELPFLEKVKTMAYLIIQVFKCGCMCVNVCVHMHAYVCVWGWGKINTFKYVRQPYYTQAPFMRGYVHLWEQFGFEYSKKE